MQESITEEYEDDSDYDLNDVAYVDSDRKTQTIVSPRMKMTKDEDIEPKVYQSNRKNQIYSPTVFYPLDSPRAPPMNPSSKLDTHTKGETKSLRLLSRRFSDSTISNSSPLSPHMSTDHSISSEDSDNEVMVCMKEIWKILPFVITACIFFFFP